MRDTIVISIVFIIAYACGGLAVSTMSEEITGDYPVLTILFWPIALLILFFIGLKWVGKNVFDEVRYFFNQIKKRRR